MTDLMQRLRAADPLAGRLPDALPQPPRPSGCRAEGRRRHARRLGVGVIAAAALAALVVFAAGRSESVATAAYAAVATGDDVVHMIMTTTVEGHSDPRTRREVWLSRDSLHSVSTDHAGTTEVAISPTSWQHYNSEANTLIVDEYAYQPQLPQPAPGELDPIDDFKSFYQAGRIVEDGEERFDGQEVRRLVVRDAPDRLTYLVEPTTGEPVAVRRRTRTISGVETTEVQRILLYERLPLNDRTRDALRMSDHPRARVDRPTPSPEAASHLGPKVDFPTKTPEGG